MSRNKTLAGKDKPYKYRTERIETSDNSDNSKQKKKSNKSQDEFVSDAVENFITDSLWQATIKPEFHTSDTENDEEYRDDMLYMKEETTSSEVVDFLRRCIENPFVVEDNIVWNFSTHTIKEEAIDEVHDMEQTKFLIPYQVTGAWGFMFSLLPEEIREAEILVYNSSDKEYKAYRSLYRTTPNERVSQIRQDLSRRLVRESGEEIGLLE